MINSQTIPSTVQYDSLLADTPSFQIINDRILGLAVNYDYQIEVYTRHSVLWNCVRDLGCLLYSEQGVRTLGVVLYVTYLHFRSTIFFIYFKYVP